MQSLSSDFDLRGGQLKNAVIQNISGSGDWLATIGGIIGFMSANGDKRLAFWDDQISSLIKVPRLDRAEVWTAAPAFNANFTVGSATVITNLNADFVDGYSTSTTAVNATIPVYSTGGTLFVATPTLGNHAVTKDYADSLGQGLNPAAGGAARVATTASIADLSNASVTIDGVTLIAGDRVLVKDNASPDGIVAVSNIYNGIYVVGTVGGGAAPFTRATDSDATAELDRQYVFVSSGTVNVSRSYFQITDNPVVNTDPIIYTLFYQAAAYLNGNGIDITGVTVSVKVNNLTTYTAGGILYHGSTSTISAVALTGIVKGNGASAPTAVLPGTTSGVTSGTIAKFSSSSPYLVDSVITESAGNVTITGGLTVTGTSTLATTLTGMLKGASGVISAVTGATNRVAFWSDANTISSDANITWNGTLLALGTSKNIQFAADGKLVWVTSPSYLNVNPVYPATLQWGAIASSKGIHITQTGDGVPDGDPTSELAIFGLGDVSTTATIGIEALVLDARKVTDFRIKISTGGGVGSLRPLIFLMEDTECFRVTTAAKACFSTITTIGSATAGAQLFNVIGGRAAVSAASEVYAIGVQYLSSTGAFYMGASNAANADGIFSNGGGGELWRMTYAGIWQSNGPQTVQSSTGAITFATGAGNGNIILAPHGTGKVGVGMTTLYAELQVLATATAAVPAAGAGTTINGLFLAGDSAGAFGLMAGVLSSGAGWIQAQQETTSGATYTLALNPNGGSVVIGAIVASKQFHVTGTAGVNGLFQSTGTSAGIEVKSTGSPASDWLIQADGGINSTAGFAIYSLTASAYRFVIDGTGKTGIGTSAPSTLLHVGLAGTTLGTIGVAGSTSGLVTIQPAVAAGTWTLTLPTTAGTADYFLKTNGSGVTSWSNSLPATTTIAGVDIPRIKVILIGAGTDPVVTHNLNSQNVVVQVRRVLGPFEQVLVDNDATDNNTVTFHFRTAPGSGVFMAIIMAI